MSKIVPKPTYPFLAIVKINIPITNATVIENIGVISMFLPDESFAHRYITKTVKV
ncbi:hypothetical protein D3C76_1516960 [compost metagenome]